MKQLLFAITVTAAIGLTACNNKGGKTAGSAEPWAEAQLMEPADLNRILLDSTAEKPVVLSIGFGGGIPGSVEMGPAKDETSLEKLKTTVAGLPKDKAIVIYCGCCPFANCPNVRPAFNLLNNMGFTNHKLLNLRDNFKTDWIDKGFAVSK